MQAQLAEGPDAVGGWGLEWRLRTPFKLVMNAPLAAISQLSVQFQALRAAHAAAVPDVNQRKQGLRRLRALFKARLPQMERALLADYGRRSRHESLLADAVTVLREIDHALSGVGRWARPRRAGFDPLMLPASAMIEMRPLGVVGIIAPWNYPVNLALCPLVAAMAAGNAVMLKPSELTPATSRFLAELLAEVYSRDQVCVVEGDVAVARAFAELPFDHLLFTGSTPVGRQVMAAAAPNLTPVTLELGGKSPVIISPGYPLDQAAARIVYGKLINAGQTCIAPDYVLLPRGQTAAFTAAIERAVEAQFGDYGASADLTAIISQRHYDRLHGLVEDARACGATVQAVGTGPTALPERVMALHLAWGMSERARLLDEEIFGPILPLIEVDDADQAVAYVNARPRPLALYLFDRDRRRQRALLAKTIAGGVTINDVLYHQAHAGLPFGGIGPSGMGVYHGHWGFKTFSKELPVFRQSGFSPLHWLKPPYRRFADLLLRFNLR